MPRISQLTALTTPDSSDELAIVDASAATTKKITRNDLLKGSPLPADTVDTQSIADEAVTSDKIDFASFDENERPVGSLGGSILYRKVISFGSLPDNGIKQVSHGISNLGIVLSLRGVAANTTSGARLTIPYVLTSGTANNDNISLLIPSADTSSVQIVAGSDRTSYTQCYIIIEYTKTA